METRILSEIKRIEKLHGVTVLHACETGSRAWGFPSPDSDYDIRLIYKHDVDWYLSLSEKKDTIEYMSEDKEIDLSGWDIKKSLQLLWKSNAPLLERIQSPIVYHSSEGFIESFHEIAKLCYSPIATMHHYLSMAEKGLNETKDTSEVKLKKLFYALRAATACKWILDKETMPPILFTIMLDELELENDFKKHIYSLIEMKATKDESYIHQKESEIIDFITEQVHLAKGKYNELSGRKEKHVDLDTYFREVLKKY
ncbi:MAG: DNA polymerase beta superfamily protein [Flavobacteriales bacterium]